MDIDLYYNSNEISSIIKQQNELKEFNFYGFYKLSSNDIFSSLEYQKNSLISLKFHDINFQHCILQNVIKLHNLKSLEIIYCYGMTLELCQIFEFASFKLKELSIKNIWGKLKTLDIYSGCHINLSILPYLKNLKIKNLNIYLNAFIIESFFTKLAENLSNTITKISFVTAEFVV
ncbi:15118_t:CDS:2 [Rhizophagus irregularis]|nr:15118_t:CDS:2 [Rhizophagus irregularis]